MVAPGMAFVSVSERGWQAADTARMPRFYLDLRMHRTSAETGETPWTPAIGIAFQLDVALGLMADEGRDAIFGRHAACAAATQAGLEALGFRLFADPAHRSPTVTAAWIPDGLDWKAFNADLKRRSLVLAGGQGQLKGRILRVGHLGTVTLDEILGAIGVLEEVSLLHGRDVIPGAAVAAAQRAGVESLGVATAVAAGA
jgi:aspartate aminotransferase-like enzyme